MGKVRECFVCSMLLARLEQKRVEATASGGKPEEVEVCVRCHARVLGGGHRTFVKGRVGYVLRPRRVYRDLLGAEMPPGKVSRGRAA